MSKRQPAEAFDPRDFCREEMAERGLIDGQMTPAVLRWLRGETQLTVVVAEGLAARFGTSRRFWLNLESAFRRKSKP